MADKRPALGKGLSALIPDAPEPPSTRTSLEVDIDLLSPNDVQPRGAMADDRLQELARSIQANGIIQPIVVRPQAGGRFQIIAGERRWRAAQRAGLTTVPVVVRDVPEDQKQRRLEMALIENIQRENLNPIEEAQAYRTLVHDFGLSHEAVAAQVGKDRSSVANTLRLLRLPDDIRTEIAEGRLSMGHARALVALTSEAEQRRVARDVLTRQLSVRQTEALVKQATTAPATAPPSQRSDVHTRAAEGELKRALGSAVTIKRRGAHGERGDIVIAFASEQELQRLYEHLTSRH